MPFVEQGGLSVAIIGATGCIGKELVYEVVAKIDVRALHLFATPKRTGDMISVEDRSLPIKALPKEGLPPEIMVDLDAVFFACPVSVVLAHAETLAEEGIAVFDITGAMAVQVGYSAVDLAPNEELFSERRICALASPTASALARVYQVFKEFGAWGFQSTVMLSASRFGTAGIEELSQQVMALFSTNEPKKKVFPEGLAFDVLPVLGAVQADGESAPERKVNLEISNLLQLSPQYVRTTINLVPIFSGIVCNATIAMGTIVPLEEIVSRLQEKELITVDELSPTPRNCVGEGGVFVSRIRENSMVQGFDCWIGCDNVGATVHQAVQMMAYYQLVGLI